MGFSESLQNHEIRMLAKKARKLADKVGYHGGDHVPQVVPVSSQIITIDSWFQTTETPTTPLLTQPGPSMTQLQDSDVTIRMVKSSHDVYSKAVNVTRKASQMTMYSTSSSSTSSTLSSTSTSSTISTASFYSHLSSFNALDNLQIEALLTLVTNPFDRQFLNRLHYLNAERDNTLAQLLEISPKFFESALSKGVSLQDTLKAYILHMERGKEDLLNYNTGAGAGGVKMINNLEHRKRMAKTCLALVGA